MDSDAPDASSAWEASATTSAVSLNGASVEFSTASAVGRALAGRDRELGSRKIRDGLQSLSVPRGLAALVAEADQHVAMRLYILDNSGSMLGPGGRLLPEAGEGREAARSCTPWEEVRAMALAHARWNLAVGTPCAFALLNPTSRRPTGSVGEFVRVAIPRHLRALEAMLAEAERVQMKGSRPLADRLQEVQRLLSAEAAGIRQRKQTAMVVLAIGGLPTPSTSAVPSTTAKDQVSELLCQIAEELPAKTVVRLVGAADAQAMSYYQGVAAKPLDQDIPAITVFGSAMQTSKAIVAAGNRWFTYWPLLHRLREGGTLCTMLHSLSTRSWNGLEARQFVEMITPDHFSEPWPSEPPLFSARLQDMGFVPEAMRFDPFTGEMRPFADSELLLVLMEHYAKEVAERQRVEQREARVAARKEQAQRVLVCLLPWRKQQT